MMCEENKNDRPRNPILFPYDPEKFWMKIRSIIQEELLKLGCKSEADIVHEIPGLKYKPLYKIKEVCEILGISKPTIYSWIRHGKLKPHKIRSKVYFLWNDIVELLKPF